MRVFTGIPRLLWFCLLILTVAAACKYDKPTNRNRISFKSVVGVNYIEVKRRFGDGLSVSKYGYGLTPSWKMSFYSDDSAKVFSPDANAFLGFHVTLDHDSLFHVARSWFRAKKITKDSLVMQVMKVQSKVIYLDKSQVFLTLYSDKYIRDVLHTVPQALMGKTKSDTSFIKQRTAEVNAHPDSAFIATNSPVFTSRTPLATVKKIEVKATVMNNYDNYDLPKYDITIKNKYKNFNYPELVVVIDYKGKVNYLYSMWTLPEGGNETIKVILDNYVKTYFHITPGNTFGINHNSYAFINLKGIKE
ncbi:hypothetical protein [Mucilaginibacter sp. HD30]